MSFVCLKNNLESSLWLASIQLGEFLIMCILMYGGLLENCNWVDLNILLILLMIFLGKYGFIVWNRNQKSLLSSSSGEKPDREKDQIYEIKQ